MDVLITILQACAAIAMVVGIILIDDTGLQLFLTGVILLTLMVVIEARRSA